MKMQCVIINLLMCKSMCKSSIWLVKVHSLLLVNSHFLSFKKPLLAKDGHGHRVPLRLSVLSLRVLGPPHPEEEAGKPASAVAADVLITSVVLAP